LTKLVNKEEVYQTLMSTGVLQIDPICDLSTVEEFNSMWLDISKNWNNIFDMDNEHILLVFESNSKGLWPPEEGKVWPGSKQMTTYGNLFWKTTSIENIDEGVVYTIELQESRSTTERIFYPSDNILQKYKSLIAVYDQEKNNIIKNYFPLHRATFNNITYCAGNAFLPLHNDGDGNIDTSRIVQTLDNTKDHTIYVNNVKYNFVKGESYLFNAYIPHEIKPAAGRRLTISSCIIKN
jgi:hypothetical protein